MSDEIELEVPGLDVEHTVSPPEKMVRGPYKKTGKYSKKKRKVRKPTVSGEKKTESIKSEKSAYEQLMGEYESKLDPDSTEDKDMGEKGPENSIEDITGESQKPERKKLTGGSLILLTKVIMPILNRVAIRVISKGKIKVPLSDLRADDESMALLQELADDSADEILGQIPPYVVYLLCVVALNANIVMDVLDNYKMDDAKLDKKKEPKIEVADVIEDLEFFDNK